MFHPLLPQAIFDRNRKDELPGLQLEWIDGICAPLYEVTQLFGLRASLLSISDASSQSVTAGSTFFMKSRLHPVLFKERSFFVLDGAAAYLNEWKIYSTFSPV